MPCFFTLRVEYENDFPKGGFIFEFVSTNLTDLQDTAVDKFINRTNSVVFIYSFGIKGIVEEARYDFRNRDEFGFWKIDS